MFTVQYYGPGCSRVNSNVFQFSQIGKNVALSKFWWHHSHASFDQNFSDYHLHRSQTHLALKRQRKNIAQITMWKWIFFFLLIFCILVTSCATWAWTIFFYPAIVGAKQDWQTKVLLFPTEILFRHDLLHKTAKWLKKVTVCCAKIWKPQKQEISSF